MDNHASLRLHPLTVLHRFIVSIPGFIILLLPILRDPGGASVFNFGLALAYAGITLPIILLRYQRFRYTITDREIIIRSGVLTTRRRNIPLDRIQNVEIEQKLLPRLFSTAKVRIMTAGSTSAEGVLEYVSLSEARRVQQVIRVRQSGLEHSDSTPSGEDERDAKRAPASAPTALVELPLSHVLLSGVLRFSLLYIALIYSGLQLIEPDPVRLAEMLSRNRADRLIFLMSESPVASGAAVVFAAALLSWISGIAVNLNRYYRFRAWLTDGKLQKRHGLLTVAEGTIPLKKVQAVIFRSNPLMMRLGWWAVEAQTMGLDVRQQGHQMAVPLAKLQVARRVGAAILPIRPLSDYMSVSPRFVRRATFRYSLALLAMSAPIGYWQPQLLFGTPLLVPLAYWFARAQYRQHGYDVDDEWLRVRRGVIRHMEWHVPLRYAHVFYTSQTLFQRRLGLKTLYVDTAGASPVSYPAILDLPETTADRLRRTLYRRFQEVLEASAGLPGSSSPADVRSEQMPR